MEELIKNLEKEDIKDIYDIYLDLKSLIDELNGSKKELPPKEEL